MVSSLQSYHFGLQDLYDECIYAVFQSVNLIQSMKNHNIYKCKIFQFLKVGNLKNIV